MATISKAVVGAFRWLRAEWQAAVTALSLALAVAGLAFGFYWYVNPKPPNPAPSYAVLPSRSLLVQGHSSATSGVGVTYNGQTMSGQDIVALTIYFWNDGNAPMREGDVLTPFVLGLPVGTKVLDARVLAQTRSVCGVRAENLQNESGAVLVGFRILEHGDGAKIQIIYAGDPLAQVRLNGAIIGAASPTEKGMESPSKYTREQFFYREAFVPLAIILLLLEVLTLRFWLEFSKWGAEIEGSLIEVARDHLRETMGIRQRANDFVRETCEKLGMGSSEIEGRMLSLESYAKMEESYTRMQEKSTQAAGNYRRKARSINYLWGLSLCFACMCGWIFYKDIKVVYFPPHEIPPQVFRL
jgi:hypothetical protein